MIPVMSIRVLVTRRELKVFDLGRCLVNKLFRLLLNYFARFIIIKRLNRVPLRLLERFVIRAVDVATVFVLQWLDIFWPQAVDTVDACFFLLLPPQVCV